MTRVPATKRPSHTLMSHTNLYTHVYKYNLIAPLPIVILTSNQKIIISGLVNRLQAVKHLLWKD